MVKFNDQNEYEFMWRNNGLHIPKATPEDIAAGKDSRPEFVSFEDAVATTNSSEWIPIIMENVIREAIEPALFVTNQLFTTYKYKPGITETFGSIGAMVAEDITEGGEYPEADLSTGAGIKGVITPVKSGLSFKITDEMKKYSQYDVINQRLKAVGRALARHKEFKAWKMFDKLGITTHDNTNFASSSVVFGKTTGRGLSGAGNGSLTMDDIIETYSAGLMNGFYLDTIIVNPLTYMMFMKDPILKTFAINNGGSSNWYNQYNGNPADIYPFSNGNLGKLGPQQTAKTGTLTAKQAQEYTGTANPVLPDYLGIPFKILVSNTVPFNPSTKVTDLYFVDSSNVGAIFQDDEVTVEEVPMRTRDTTKIKAHESYAMVPLCEGHGIYKMKNVSIDANALAVPVQAVGPTINAELTRKS